MCRIVDRRFLNCGNVHGVWLRIAKYMGGACIGGDDYRGAVRLGLWNGNMAAFSAFIKAMGSGQ